MKKVLIFLLLNCFFSVDLYSAENKLAPRISIAVTITDKDSTYAPVKGALLQALEIPVAPKEMYYKVVSVDYTDETKGNGYWHIENNPDLGNSLAGQVPDMFKKITMKCGENCYFSQYLPLSLLIKATEVGFHAERVTIPFTAVDKFDQKHTGFLDMRLVAASWWIIRATPEYQFRRKIDRCKKIFAGLILLTALFCLIKFR